MSPSFLSYSHKTPSKRHLLNYSLECLESQLDNRELTELRIWSRGDIRRPQPAAGQGHTQPTINKVTISSDDWS